MVMTITYKNITTAREEAGQAFIGIATLNRPSVLNALNHELMTELVAATGPDGQPIQRPCKNSTGTRASEPSSSPAVTEPLPPVPTSKKCATKQQCP